MIDANMHEHKLVIEGHHEDVLTEYSNITYWLVRSVGETEGPEKMLEVQGMVYDACCNGLDAAWEGIEYPPNKLKKFISRIFRKEND